MQYSQPKIFNALNIIGCGRLGRTLAKLWSDAGTLSIGGICNRGVDSGKQALWLYSIGVPC